MDKKSGRVSALLLTMFVLCLASIPVYAASATTQATSVINTPIVLTESYRLDRNIIASGDAFEIRNSFVTLDLNGFSVQAGGAGVVTTGTSQEKVAVVNGSISARAGAILLSAGDCRVEGVEVSGRGGAGISVGSNCIVRNNTISASNVGIECPQACVVSGNTIQDFGDAGISAKVGSLVLGNRVSGGAGVGLRLDDATGYANNVLSNNAGGDVSGGVQIGANLCATTIVCGP